MSMIQNVSLENYILAIEHELGISRVLSSGIRCHVASWKSTNISKEHVTSVFRAEEYAKKESSMKQAVSTALRP
jgi:hypothetical protein